MSEWYTTSVLKRFSIFEVRPNERIYLKSKIGFDINNPVFHCSYTTLRAFNLEWDSNIDIIREHPYYTFKVNSTISAEASMLLVLVIEGDIG